MRFFLFFSFFLSSLYLKSQVGEFGIGASCVYQKWKENFDLAPNVSVGVNKTLFTFSHTLSKGEGKQLSDLGGSDWVVAGEMKRTFGIGYFIRVEEDMSLWIVPVLGASFVSEILQTNNGWIYGQAKIKPSARIDIRYTPQTTGLGYFISFGNVENGSIGLTWRYK